MINIRNQTGDLLCKYGIDRATTERLFDEKLLDENICKRVLIVNEYNRQLRVSGKTKYDIKIQIADRYCVSYSTVEKYIAALNGC
jgi:hypothetical protein